MGSCVSVHKEPESAMKLRFSIGSKNEKLLIPSPVKENSITVNAGDRTDVTSLPSPARFTCAGSKDEAFFDSQPWLESDCEDDFLSVNGDFTPSRGNTPMHPNSASGKLLYNKLPAGKEATNSIPEPSPPDKKKRLSELFKESLRENEYNDEENSAADKNEATSLAQQLKSTNETPYFSRVNSGESCVNGVGEKSVKSPQCCLPKLLLSRSLNERKNRASYVG